MKKTRKLDPDMSDEYDFSGAPRGRYAARYAKGTNLVLLDPDVATLFHNSASVNMTLRGVFQLLQEGSVKRDPATLEKFSRDLRRLVIASKVKPNRSDSASNKSGKVQHHRGNTLVKTLRKHYGPDFAAGVRSDMTLRTLLKKKNASTLDQFLKRDRR